MSEDGLPLIEPLDGPNKTTRSTLDDLAQAIAFLRGRYIDDVKKSHEDRRKTRLKEDGARAAIVRLLKMPGDLNPDMRSALVRAFEPDESKADREAGDFRRRQIDPKKGCVAQIVRRQEGKPPSGSVEQTLRFFREQFEIGREVAICLEELRAAQAPKRNGLVKVAIGHVMKKHKLNERAVKDARAAYEKYIKGASLSDGGQIPTD